MDAQYLSHLVHPIRKTPLQYDAAGDQLVDANGDRFLIKSGVPVLLTTAEDVSLTGTEQHREAESAFHYKEHYQADAATYDYFAASESKTEQGERRRLHQYILAQIPATADWVMDTGCGGGWLATALRGRNKHVISMDISDINPIKVTKNVAYATHYGLVGDVFELPIAPASIDCIVASEIIEHVSDPKRFIESLYAALKPGGRLIITTPYNERIQYSLCIHCNQLTPNNAHLHSFTEGSIARCLPAGVHKYRTKVFNNKILVRLGMQRLFSFLPRAIWQAADDLFNTFTGKRAYRLMLVIDK